MQLDHSELHAFLLINNILFCAMQEATSDHKNGTPFNWNFIAQVLAVIQVGTR